MKWGVETMQQTADGKMKRSRDSMTTIRESVGTSPMTSPPRLKPTVILQGHSPSGMRRMSIFFNLYDWFYCTSVVCVKAIHVSEFCGCVHRTEQRGCTETAKGDPSIWSTSNRSTADFRQGNGERLL